MNTTMASVKGAPSGLYEALKKRYGGSFDPSEVPWNEFCPEWRAWAICRFPISVARKIVKIGGVAGLEFSGFTVTGWCAMEGDLRRMCMALSNGGSADAPSSRGWCPIHACAASGNEKCIPVLAGYGCNMDARGADGMTACHVSAMAGSIGCLGMLVSYGCDPFLESDGGRNAVDYASASGNRKCVRMLVSLRGFDAGHTDQFGNTPLYRCSTTDCASILLSAGVDPRSVNKMTRKAWQESQFIEVRELLMKAICEKRNVQPDWGKF
jgi:ankyrin repeat protein